MTTMTSFSMRIEVHPDNKLNSLLDDLSLKTPWGNRRIAAQKLGDLRNPVALPKLLEVLITDPFWMVRYSIIEAINLIGDPRAISTLREVAKSDGYQVIRSYAAKVVEKLS